VTESQLTGTYVNLTPSPSFSVALNICRSVKNAATSFSLPGVASMRRVWWNLLRSDITPSDALLPEARLPVSLSYLPCV
jgi:hypothetical protein